MNILPLSAIITNTLISHSKLVYTILGISLIMCLYGLYWALKMPTVSDDDIARDIEHNNEHKTALRKVA